MTDREKLIDLLLIPSKTLEYEDAERIVKYLIAHGVTVREKQKPLTVEEIAKLPKVVYVECAFSVDIQVGLPDRICGTIPSLWIQFFDCSENFRLDKYGKTWRCWAEKPTEEERKAAGWM